jgi:uncharacterized membrane protein
MAKYLVAYLGTAFFFLATDYIWLSQVAKKFYSDRLGSLLLDQPNLRAALAFYALYVVGIVFFAVLPGLRAGSVTVALSHGALFGLIAYATYDMTNYATLKNWPVSVTLVDIVWGTVLTAASASFGYMATQLVLKS